MSKTQHKHQSVASHNSSPQKKKVGLIYIDRAKFKNQVKRRKQASKIVNECVGILNRINQDLNDLGASNTLGVSEEKKFDHGNMSNRQESQNK